MKNSDQ